MTSFEITTTSSNTKKIVLLNTVISPYNVVALQKIRKIFLAISLKTFVCGVRSNCSVSENICFHCRPLDSVTISLSLSRVKRAFFTRLSKIRRQLEKRETITVIKSPDTKRTPQKDVHISTLFPDVFIRCVTLPSLLKTFHLKEDANKMKRDVGTKSHMQHFQHLVPNLFTSSHELCTVENKTESAPSIMS